MAKDTDDADSQELIERADRLKDAVKRGGGAADVARQIGMPLATLNNYLAGRDMKASALVKLADGCDVSVEWLATGRGPKMAQSQSQSIAAFPGFTASQLAEPANFYVLCLLLIACQEYHFRLGIVPTLSDVFGWISSPYARRSTIPDQKIELKKPEEPES